MCCHATNNFHVLPCNHRPSCVAVQPPVVVCFRTTTGRHVLLWDHRSLYVALQPPVIVFFMCSLVDWLSSLMTVSSLRLALLHGRTCVGPCCSMSGEQVLSVHRSVCIYAGKRMFHDFSLVSDCLHVPVDLWIVL